MRTIVAILCGWVLAGIAHAQQPGWIADPGTGCRVWNDSPVRGEHILWNGPCTGGVANGRGTLQWFFNQRPTDRYVGGLADGRENGQGSYFWADGGRYEGQWRNGKAHGLGTRTNEKGEAFTGQFTNGCLQEGKRTAWVGATREECGFK